MSRLAWMNQSDNALSGAIPPELGGLSKRDTLWVSGNNLTGCVPPALTEVVSNDLVNLGLPTC